MPYHVQKRGAGDRPYKIIGPGGRVLGSSRTRRMAERSIAAREAGKRRAKR